MRTHNSPTAYDQTGNSPFRTHGWFALSAFGELSRLRDEAIRDSGAGSRSIEASGDDPWIAQVRRQAGSAQEPPKSATNQWRRPPRSALLRSLRPPRRSLSSWLACCLLCFVGLVTLASAAVLVLVFVRGDEQLYALTWRLVGEFFATMVGARQTREQRAADPTTTTTTWLFGSPIGDSIRENNGTV
ncbi:uncharacterized protein LOC144105558 [Amblyomma americanum]